MKHKENVNGLDVVKILGRFGASPRIKASVLHYHNLKIICQSKQHRRQNPDGIRPPCSPDRQGRLPAFPALAWFVFSTIRRGDTCKTETRFPGGAPIVRGILQIWGIPVSLRSIGVCRLSCQTRMSEDEVIKGEVFLNRKPTTCVQNL